jgi:malate dehydrogenase
MLLRAADSLQSPLVTELSLYDIVHAPGVAIDLNHIDTPGKVTGYLPADGGLEKTLVGAEIVVIPAGIARKPGMTRDGIPSILRRPESRSRTNPGVADLFKTNANVIRDLLEGVARFCPKAYVCIITNPVNSTLPIACKVLERHGVLDPRKVFGVTTLDVVRASTFAAHALGIDDPKKYQVPVVGGHSGATILPLFSQSSPAIEFSQGQLDAVTNRE